MKLLGKLPIKCYLACSGGKDSMTILNFLLKGNREVELLYFNHNTEHGKEAVKFLSKFSKENNIALHVEEYKDTVQTEEAWRNARYNFFSKFKDRPIITGHHLNDNIETYLMSSIKGTEKFIPYSRGNIIRPFLLASREELDNFALKWGVTWIEDPSNSECNYARNKIRNQVIPVLREVNPGLTKVFFNKCLSKYKKDGL